ncbi:MAG: hypothetical protein IPM92_00585 [Saprospiraceae bacterium]|nr:hypothetical protein [Saprospiraceae bacterium]
MKFEQRQQEVAAFSNFLTRLGMYSLFAFVLIVISLLMGTVGYHHFGQLNWVDSFYMTSMILTGMGPIAEMNSDASKYFSSFYALYSGIAFLSITAVFLAPIIHRILHILHVEKTEEPE